MTVPAGIGSIAANANQSVPFVLMPTNAMEPGPSDMDAVLMLQACVIARRPVVTASNCHGSHGRIGQSFTHENEETRWISPLSNLSRAILQSCDSPENPVHQRTSPQRTNS